MRGPERNIMAEGTPGPGNEGPPQGNQPQEAGQTPARSRDIIRDAGRGLGRIFGRGSESGAGQPPEDGDSPPAPPGEPPREPGVYKYPRGVDIAHTVSPNQPMIPLEEIPNIQVDEEGNITNRQTGEAVTLTHEPEIPPASQLEELTPAGQEATERLEEIAAANPPRGPEGPPPPEGPRGPEWETSPERGRWIVEQIVEMRTTMSYEQRYSGENGQRLRMLYDNLQDFVNKISEIRNEKDPWDRFVRDDQGRVTGVKQIEQSRLLLTRDTDGIYHLDRQEPATQQVVPEQPENQTPPEDLTGLLPINQLLALYQNDNTPPDQITEVERQLGIYFREARRKGLLQGADRILKPIYQGVESGDSQTIATLPRSLAQAEENISNIFSLTRRDPEVFRLAGIGSIYIRWARERLDNAIAGREQPPYREGELRFDQEQEGENRETYWEVGNYPKYYHITAKTPEQFLIAKETFLNMIRDGSLGKSPDEIYQHVDNFKEVFGSEGGRQAKAGNVSSEFIKEQRLELEAQLYVFGADYSNETYNPEQYKKFMMAMALHEGPERWVRLLRSGDGQVGAFTHIFDKEALMEIFNNSVGERGELDIMAQHFLQDQVRQMVIERGMGIVLKNYNPDDVLLNSDSPQSRIDRATALERILSDIRRGKKADQLSKRDQEIYGAFKANLERVGLHMSDDKFKNMYEGFDRGDAHLQNYQLFKDLSPEDFDQLPNQLKNSINLGRVQERLQVIQARIRSGEITVYRRDQTAVDFLTAEERKIFTDAYSKAEASFDIAFQMQGASGEKVRRGRGFFYIERNAHVQFYNEIEERSSKIEWLLGQLKNKKIGDFGVEVQNFYNSLTEEEKKPNPQGLYGIKSKSLTDNQRRSIYIGWMLSEMKNDRRLDSFSPEEQAFYNRLSEEDRSSYEDHMPVYLAEKAVQTIVTRTKIQYANAKPVGNKSGAEIRTEAVEKMRAYAIEQIKKDGWQAKFELPKILFDDEGEVVGWDENTKETMDFQTAAQHIYSRYTTHTYWGYQGENRHMVLRDDLFEAAKRIRSGQSSSEDEDVLATQLLIIDPTLKRVKRFPTGQIKREIQLFQAAVNESFLGHTYINKDLFKAFLPADGNRGKMHSGYNWEDWGGTMRFAVGIRELAASQPERFTRRLGAEIASMPMYVDSMAAIWGQDGVMGAVSMFADKIKDIGHQGLVSQFGIAKFINNMDRAVQLYNALIGSVNDQELKHVEGLYMKPTNDNETLHKFAQAVIGKFFSGGDTEKYLEFLHQLRATFGRLETVLKIMRIMYSDDRNAGGALRLENVDIFLENGRFNPAIENAPEIYMMTGTSRQLESDFYDEFASWLTSEWPGGGGQIYPEELVWNKWLTKKLYVFAGKDKTVEGSKTFKSWFFEKAGL